MTDDANGVPTTSDENHAEEISAAAPAQCTVLGCGGCVWSAAGLLFLFVMVALFLPARCVVREAPRRMQCTNNLKLIGLAMHNYHQMYGCFPPAYIADAKGRPLHSWRVLILPFMEAESLYKKIRLDEPWDSTHNREVFQKEPALKVYRCPSADNPKDETCYVMIVGPDTISDGPHSVRLEDIKDGTSNTIMIAEIKDSGIHWAEPRDLDYQNISFQINDPNGRGIGSYHREYTNVTLADGSVRSIRNDTDPKLLKALITINGRENLDRIWEQY